MTKRLKKISLPDEPLRVGCTCGYELKSGEALSDQLGLPCPRCHPPKMVSTRKVGVPYATSNSGVNLKVDVTVPAAPWELDA